MLHTDFTTQYAHDTIKNWAMGGSIKHALEDQLFNLWFQRYITFRTVSLYTFNAPVVGKLNVTKTVVVPWPTGLGTLSSYLYNNQEAFAIMGAFLRGERAGLLVKMQEAGIEFVSNRELLPPPI